jgi:DNA-binding PadR family transcriptional regulator
MRDGYLRNAVMQQLKRKPHSGYSLMKALSEEIGWKPSPGSMYPLLQQLLKEQIVTVKKSDRKRIYSLTKIGQEEAKSITDTSIMSSDIQELAKLSLSNLEDLSSTDKKEVHKQIKSILSTLRGAKK